LDLAVTNLYSNTVSVLLGTGGAGAFLPASSFASGKGPAWLGSIPFTANGKPDLIVANSFEDTLTVLFNTSPNR
jgi:hypothetical protein